MRIGKHNILVFALVALLAFVGQSSVSAQTQFSELTKVNLKSAGFGAQFGSSVGVDGNTMISGAPDFSLTQSSREGAAFVYARQPNGAWTLQQPLIPDTVLPGSKAGSCVGISGDTAIVGVPYGTPSVQSVYVFVRTGTTWMQQQRIMGAGCGYGCAISGNTIITSAFAPGSVLAFGESHTTDSVNDIALQPNGKIIAIDYVQSNQFTGSAPTHTGIVRFNPNGSLDTSFGTSGKKTTADDGFQLLDVLDLPKAVALQPNGKIVVAGDYRFRVGQGDVMILRFLGEGTTAARGLILTAMAKLTFQFSVRAAARGISKARRADLRASHSVCPRTKSFLPIMTATAKTTSPYFDRQPVLGIFSARRSDSTVSVSDKTATSQWRLIMTATVRWMSRFTVRQPERGICNAAKPDLPEFHSARTETSQFRTLSCRKSYTLGIYALKIRVSVSDRIIELTI